VWDPETNALIPGTVRLGNAEAPKKTVAFKGNRIEALKGFIEPTEESALQGIAKRNVDIVLDDRGVHPVLYTQGGEHRIALHSPHQGLSFRFSAASWDDWRGRAFYERDYPNGRSGKGLFMSYPQFGVVYRPGDRAKTVAKKGLNAKGRLWHHWELIGYKLLPLSSAMSSASGKNTPSCAQTGRLDNDTRKTQIPLISKTVAMLAGAGRADMGNWQRLDLGLFNDPKRLFKKYFKSHANIKGRVQVRW
ncbi:MAG: hypothetical protein KJO08_06215, partial [Gammaproteobacteria bacterium]|nr:hypothetical protein [Gammaproteobacteria bacterium]